MKFLKFFLLILLTSVTQGLSQEIPAEEVKRYMGSFGCIVPLTGNYSKLGEMALRGVSTAAQAVNSIANYRIILKDSNSTEKGAYYAYNQILKESNPRFIIGPLPSNHVTEIEKNSPTIDVPLVIFPVLDRAANRNNVVSFYLPVKNQVESLVDYSVNDLRLRNFAIISPDTAVGNRFTSQFKNSLQRSEGKLVYEGKYGPDLSELDLHIMWLESYKIDAIFIPDGAKNSSFVIRKIITDDDIANIIFLGPNTWNSDMFYSLSKDNFDGVLYKIVFADFINTKSEDWIKFSNMYTSLYGSRPNTLEYQIYLATLYFLEKDIRAQTGIDTGLVNVSLSPRPMIFTIQDGRIVKLK